MAHIKTCVMWRGKSNKRGSLRVGPWRQCVIPLEKGNPSHWTKMERKQMRRRHVARTRWEEISHLNQVGTYSMGDKEKIRERKRKKRKERRRKEK